MEHPAEHTPPTPPAAQPEKLPYTPPSVESVELSKEAAESLT